jgi:uncharacterized protein (TIGR02266 family)
MQDDHPLRASPRIPYEVSVTLGSKHNFYAGFVQDISCGGVFISTEVLQPVGTVIDFELSLSPGMILVPVRGVVRWIRDAGAEEGEVGMGLQFIDLTPGIRRRIEAFIERRRDLIFYEPPEDL